jgi:hypothetical protein
MPVRACPGAGGLQRSDLSSALQGGLHELAAASSCHATSESLQQVCTGFAPLPGARCQLQLAELDTRSSRPLL